jgi:hypothetical protein
LGGAAQFFPQPNPPLVTNNLYRGKHKEENWKHARKHFAQVHEPKARANSFILNILPATPCASIFYADSFILRPATQ